MLDRIEELMIPDRQPQGMDVERLTLEESEQKLHTEAFPAFVFLKASPRVEAYAKS